MENLAAKVKDIWEENKIEFEDRLDDWLKRLEEGEKLIRQARSQFHQWDPLKVYVSVTRAKSKRRAVFSLRFFGQEVAELVVKDQSVVLKLTKRHRQNNMKWFQCTLDAGHYDWDGREAKKFRSYFKEKAFSSKREPKVRSPEHRVESKFIQEMLKGSGKFGVPGLKIQPVTIAGCPLQLPVPISASGKELKEGDGHIDILARHRGKDGKTRLSVWELKRAGAYDHPASQAYIYAFTLLQILRHPKNGPKWYRLFGYKSPIPKRIEIEAVVGITRNQERKFNKEKAEIEKNSPFEIAGDTFRMYAAYYEEKSDSIKFGQDPFREE